MKLEVNKTYKSLLTNKNDPRYAICMGGRANGRSYFASQYALIHLLSDNYFRCAIMRFVLGDIRNSIFQEIRDRIDEHDLENFIDIRDHRLEFQFKENKITGIGFRKSSTEQKSKLKSLASYNCIIIEEADEVDEEDFQQLDDSLRTIKANILIIFLLNAPDKNHWIIKRWFNLIPSGIDGFYKPELKTTEKDVAYFFGTFRDNIKNLNQKTIDRYLAYKDINSDHYYNMIEGLVSEGKKGRIYKDWKVITDDEYDEIPDDPYYGLDFGFSNNPAALVEIKEHNNNIYCKELLYEAGLTNIGDKGNDLDGRFNDLGLDQDTAIIWADAAEPKSIKELQDAGWDVRPSPKGADSVRSGIKVLESVNCYYTESSENIALEVQNYRWALDRNKEPTNKPIKELDHLCDAIRYGKTGKQNEEFIGFV